MQDTGRVTPVTEKDKPMYGSNREIPYKITSNEMGTYIMKFVNLTPHPVVLANGTLNVTFSKDRSTPTARVEQIIEERMIECEVAPGMFVNMPMNIVTRSEVYNLPEPEAGVVYIVSSMVATHVRRPDVISPITDSSCVRDTGGRVISVKGFQTFTASPIIPKELVRN